MGAHYVFTILLNKNIHTILLSNTFPKPYAEDLQVMFVYNLWVLQY